MSDNRIILEVLKYSSAFDVLRNLSSVNQLFSALCNTHELWFELLSSDIDLLSAHSPKARFRLINSRYVPVLTQQKLLMFIPGLRTWQSVALSVPIRLTQAASMVLMADSNVFVTGGPLECDTYSINRFSGEVKVLDSMGVHRQKMGAIRYQADIYTFAGIKSFTYPKSAEVYLCSLKQWKRLPDCLVSRCNFNPAQYQGCVYLLGGSCTQTSECYNVSAETSVPSLWREVDVLSIAIGISSRRLYYWRM